MTDDTIEKIKNDLETAAYVDRLLPPVRAPKYRCCMPEIVYTPQEMIFMEKKMKQSKKLLTNKILFSGLLILIQLILAVDERRLVWKRANRIPWKLLCREFGVSRQMLAVRYERALIKIQYGCKKCH